MSRRLVVVLVQVLVPCSTTGTITSNGDNNVAEV